MMVDRLKDKSPWWTAAAKNVRRFMTIPSPISQIIPHEGSERSPHGVERNPRQAGNSRTISAPYAPVRAIELGCLLRYTGTLL